MKIDRRNFAVTVSHINKIKSDYILKHLPAKPTDDPAKFEIDVKIFCILAHAALEEFFENIALVVLEQSVDAFLTSGAINKSLLAMIAAGSERIRIPDRDEPDEIKPFNNIRDILIAFKSEHSVYIQQENHGINLHHLRALFYPLYIEIPSNVKYKSSVQKLANFRGEYAHKQTYSKLLSPEDAVKIVADSLRFAKCFFTSIKPL